MGITFAPRGDGVGPIAPAGTSSLRYGSFGDRPDENAYDAAVDDFPELMKELPSGEQVRFWQKAESGAAHERASMLRHASEWRNGQSMYPTPEFIEGLAAQYPSTKFHSPLRHFEEMFTQVCGDLQENSSPGVSSVLGPTDGAILKNNLDLLKEIVFERLVLIASTPFDEIIKMTPEQLIERGYCDLIRLFLKKEPLKWSKLYNKVTGQKLQYGRYRLISCISLVDQIIHRMIYGKQNKAEIAQYCVIPSQPGIGFSTDAGVRAFTEASFFHPSRRQNLSKEDALWLSFLCIDFQAWDWTVKDWQLDMDAHVRRKLCNYGDELLIAKAHHLVSNGCFVLSNGELWVQILRGLMKSGWYNTSSSNSRIRAAISKIFFGLMHWIITMGDDSVEDNDKRLAEFLVWIKDIVGQTIPDDDVTPCDHDAVEFCSHAFRVLYDQDGNRFCNAQLLTWSRSLAKFLYTPKKSAEQIAGIRQACRHSPHLHRLDCFFSKAYPELWVQSQTAHPDATMV